MSLKRVRMIKKDKGFRFFDLIVYLAIALIIAAIFLAVFLTRDKNPFKGFRAYIGNDVVFECDFESGKYFCPQAEGVSVGVEGESVLTVEIVTTSGRNVLSVDFSKREVRVTDADCTGRDCVYSPPVRDNNGVIYCAPHRLRVVPYNFESGGGDIII